MTQCAATGQERMAELIGADTRTRRTAEQSRIWARVWAVIGVTRHCRLSNREREYFQAENLLTGVSARLTGERLEVNFS